MNAGSIAHGRSIDQFMENYTFDKLLSNCNGGIVENYICQSDDTGFSGKNKTRLVQSIDMGHDKLMMNVAEHKLALVMDLNSNKNLKNIDCMHEYYTTNNRVYVVHEFFGQGYKDLFMFANIKGSFSEMEIG